MRRRTPFRIECEDKADGGGLAHDPVMLIAHHHPAEFEKASGEPPC
jgi:hypothetical protein